MSSHSNCPHSPSYFLGLGLLFGLGISACSTDGAAQLDSYRRYLSIDHLESYYYTEPHSTLRYPLVRGSLRNLSNERLIVVEFTIKFLDRTNQVIFEDKAYPVFDSYFSQPTARKSLEPGQSVRFAFKSPQCPPTWEPGQIKVEISKVVPGKSSSAS